MGGCRLSGGTATETPDFDDTYRAEIARLVLDRRLMDKEHPLTRWALATIAADPVLAQASREEQVAHFARQLVRGVKVTAPRRKVPPKPTEDVIGMVIS